MSRNNSPYRGRRDSQMEVAHLQWDGVNIPEHLRYKPMKTGAEWAGVQPRYLDPVQKPKLPPFAPQRESFDTGKHWGSVQPRYLDPRVQKNPVSQVPLYEPKEIQQHKEHVQRSGQDRVSARYLDGVIKEEGQDSPRRLVERNREKNKRLTGWRANSLNTRSLTFEEIRQRNKKYLSYNYDKKPAMTKPSVVGEYIRHGTPIGQQEPSPHPPGEDEDFIGGRWIPAGGCGGGAWHRKSNSPHRAQTLRENDAIAMRRAESSSRQVSPRHVPRVAKLSPAESYRRWESQNSVREGTRSPAPREARSPAPQQA